MPGPHHVSSERSLVHASPQLVGKKQCCDTSEDSALCSGSEAFPRSAQMTLSIARTHSQFLISRRASPRR